jgi:hypothetical protein
MREIIDAYSQVYLTAIRVNCPAYNAAPDMVEPDEEPSQPAPRDHWLRRVFRRVVARRQPSDAEQHDVYLPGWLGI